MTSIRQRVEAFHLVFLRALVARPEDNGLFALKGGCNLRFFFGSVRYSEDIDLDVRIAAPRTLQARVDRLLQSPAIQAPLQTRGIEVVDVSAPNQTETTQRWKLGLKVDGVALPVRTKVEFSRRDDLDGAAFDLVEVAVVRPLALPPFLAPHYRLASAIEQKITALAHRTTPQARDVFDLQLLLARASAPAPLPEAVRAAIPLAIENAMGLGYDEYRGAVVAFLEPDQAFVFESRPAWEAAQDFVISTLERLATP